MASNNQPSTATISTHQCARESSLHQGVPAASIGVITDREMAAFPGCRALQLVVPKQRGGRSRSIGKPSVPARMVQKRLAALQLSGDDLADKDLVVSTGKDLDHPAIDVGQAIGQDRGPSHNAQDRQTRENLRPGRREPPRDVLLVEPENVHREAAIDLEIVQRVRLLIHSHQNQGRVKRQRGDRVGRQTVQTGLAAGCHNSDTGRELPHDLPLNRRIKCHEKTYPVRTGRGTVRAPKLHAARVWHCTRSASITKGPSPWRGWTTAITLPGTQGSLRCRRNLYLKPVTKKQAAATIPKIRGAKRGNHAMGKIARITAAAWK